MTSACSLLGIMLWLLLAFALVSPAVAADDVCGLLQQLKPAMVKAAEHPMSEAPMEIPVDWADFAELGHLSNDGHAAQTSPLLPLTCLAVSFALMAALVLSSPKISAPGQAREGGKTEEARAPSSEEKRRQESKTAEASFRNDIQGFRALAVVSVFIYHINASWLPGGFTGVDMFFVISGYVVTLQLLKSVDMPSDEPFLPDFFARRAKRLVPILIVVILSTSACLVLVAPLWVEQVSGMLLTGFAGLFGWANNWMLLDTKTSYWEKDMADLTENDPFFHLWSLGVEEQFYMLLGLLLAITGLGCGWPRGAAESASGNSDKIRRRLFPVILVTITLSLCLSAYFSQKSLATSYGFYFVFARFWELASGVALALRSDEIATVLAHSEACLRILDVLAAFLLAASLACMNQNGFMWQPAGEEPRFPWPNALMPVLGSLCYLAAGLGRERWSLNGLLSSRGAAYVGDLSYSIYLWHVPVLALMTWHYASVAAKSSIMNVILAISLVLLLSVTGYNLVEQPCRRARLKWWRAISIALLAMVAAASLQYLMQSYRVMAKQAKSNSFPNKFSGLYANHGCSCASKGLFHSAHSNETHDDNLPACAYESSVPSPGVDRQPCGFPKGARNGKQVFHETSPAECLFPPALNQRSNTHTMQSTVYVLGDSHAWALFPAVEAATSRRVLGLSWQGAQVADIEVDLKKVLKANDVVIWQKKIHDDNHGEKTNGEFPCFWIGDDGLSCDRSQFLEETQRLHNITSKKGAKMVLVGDSVTLRLGPEECLLHSEKADACGVSKADRMESISGFTALATNLSQTYNDIYFFDYLSLLCNEKTCDQFIPGTTISAYRDSNHLSTSGSLYLAPFLCSWFKEHGLAD